jgi:hypothetical protein
MNARPKLYEMIWLNGDQPTTCPYCGARTDVTFNLSHSIRNTVVEKCLNEKCEFEFVTETEVSIKKV